MPIPSIIILRYFAAPSFSLISSLTLFEATGSASGFETSMALTKPRGVLVLKSTVASGKELNLAPIVIDEITVLGSRCGQFGPALRLLKNNRIDFSPFITKTYSIDEALEAFEANKSRESLKILIKI